MKKLFKALSQFKQEVPVIFKATQGYGYKYADLPAIYAVITPLLAKHGIDFMQTLETENGETYLETIIMHIESGENKTSRCVIPQITLAKMNDYQSFGSGITYFRRYCLSVSLGIVTDIDNDATGTQTRKAKPAKSQKTYKQTLSTHQFNALFGLIQSGEEDSNGEIWTIERASKSFEFTSAQKKTLESL